MALSVLITQCLQNDFVKPIEAHEALPNKLHVGREEAQRLLGSDPSMGPVAQLMSWAREQARDELCVLHIRDWHDPSDPRQHAHLARFGDHCLCGSEGARLVLGLDDDIAARPNERVIDALTLNDFEGTELPTIMADLEARANGEPIRVGVAGVWTEAKVTFLLYDLRTRCEIDQLATCSALTASASRLQHFNALEQLKKILGVHVFDSIGEFTSWLHPTGTAAKPPPLRRFGPSLEIRGVDGGAVDLTQGDRDIVSYLYGDSARLELSPIVGGFSGAAVFRVRSWDATHEQAPSVTKLGARYSIGAERSAFERVEAILGNAAPRVRGFVDLGERAGIKYAFASMGGHVRTFKSLYQGGAPAETISRILETVFSDVLGRLYAGAQYERLPLLEYYRFEPKLVEYVRAKVGDILGPGAVGRSRLSFPGGVEAANVADFYESFLPTALTTTSNEYHFVSWVHGDLNGANILVDGRENIWIIDFFHTAPGHVLKDLAKLENDLLYIYTPVTDDGRSFEQALAITNALRRVQDMAAPLPEACPGVSDPQFVRAWSTIRQLRAFATTLCRSDRDPLQMSIALLRYAAHNLSFDTESSLLQRTWALAACCLHAEDIMRRARENERLRVDWLDPDVLPTRGRLGMTICPGRRDRGRVLADDLDALRTDGVHHLICLVMDQELEWAGVPGIDVACEARGIDFHKRPIADQGVPSIDEAISIVQWVSAALERGEDVALHCMGGLGRSGTLAACVLTARGVDPQAAIAAVRRTRGPRAIEIAEQARFVSTFASASRADRGR